jgi:hypothetical protein
LQVSSQNTALARALALRRVDDEEMERLEEDRQRGWRDNNGQRAIATVMTGTVSCDNHKTTRQRVGRISLIWRQTPWQFYGVAAGLVASNPILAQ